MKHPIVSSHRASVLHRLVAPLAVAALLGASPAFAQWSADPADNLVVADRDGGQAQPKIVPTADGGFYVSWFGPFSEGFDIYLQRLDVDGVAQWQDDGVLLADRNFSSTQDYGLGIDASGNGLLAYRLEDGDNIPQVAVSRVAADGTPLWGVPGIIVSNDPGGASSPRVSGTGDGGILVAWSASDGPIVVQKLDADGNPLWAPGGVSLPLPSGAFFLADLHGDADGNAIVSGSAQLSFFDRRLWAQKLAAADGASLWGADPIEVFDGSDGALQLGNFPPFLPDGAGGAVFCWYQVSGIDDATIRVQHIDAAGVAAFPQNGVEVSTSDHQLTAPSASWDSANGDIYVAWHEEYSPTPTTRAFGAFAQRIDASGARLWGDTGAELVALAEDVYPTQLRTLAVGDGAIFAWAANSYPSPMPIHAARLDANGDFAWPGDIIDLKTTADADTSRLAGALSSADFAAYVWSDGSDGGLDYGKIKAQNVDFDGMLGPVGPTDVVFADGFDGP